MIEALIVPVILAAGSSSRMGRPKALCDFDGRTCLDLVITACVSPGLTRPIVVLGQSAAEIEARIDLGAVDVVVNQHADRGQTSSLRAGLAALPAGAAGFLLFPVDFPLVCAEDVAALLRTFGSRTVGERIVIPSHGGRRGHPVAIEASLGGEFRALADGVSARQVIDRHAATIRYVSLDTDRVLMDMDTPEDYKRLLARWKSPAG